MSFLSPAKDAQDVQKVHLHKKKSKISFVKKSIDIIFSNQIMNLSLSR